MRALAFRRLLPALALLPGTLAGCGDGGSDGLAIRFEPAGPVCSFDGQSCTAEAGVPFEVRGARPADAPLAFALAFDEGADGMPDQQLVVDDVLTDTSPGFVVTDSFPIGTHALLVEVTDGDGNVATASIPFAVEDCLAPAPVCINGLAIELVPADSDVDGDGDVDAATMTIFATDFLASALPADCSEPVVASIRRAGGTADIERSSLVLTCDDLGTVPVELLAWDAVENFDFCETYVLVQDNMASCGP